MKTKRGRPSLGRRGHTRVVSIKLSEVEYAAILAAIKRDRQLIKEIERSVGVDMSEELARKPPTVSSWIREHALAPLGKSGR